jgi:hypothetical protein
LFSRLFWEWREQTPMWFVIRPSLHPACSCNVLVARNGCAHALAVAVIRRHSP